MALLAPNLHVEYQAANTQWGLSDQAAWWCGDNVDTLLGQPGSQLTNVFFERNTKSVILQPVFRYANLSTSNTTQNGGVGETGLWRSTLDRATQKQILTQYSGAKDTKWSAITTFGPIEADEAAFAVDLYLGAPPKDTMTRDSTAIYRQVIWPHVPAAGENQYRITIPYQGAPYIEKSTDLGVTFVRLPYDLSGALDPDAIRKARNVRLTIAVMVIDGDMIVSFGEDFSKGQFVELQGTAGTATVCYQAGEIKVQGEGGVTSFGFAKIRYAKTGNWISYDHPGPGDMATVIAASGVHVLPRGPDPQAAGTTVAGSLFSTDPATTFFAYQVAMTGPAAAAPDAAYAASSPCVKEVSVCWEAIETPPALTGWQDLTPIYSYSDRISFDPATRIQRYENSITIRVKAGELSPLFGVQAVRVHAGYEHERALGIPPSLRGYFVSATEDPMSASGRDGFATFQGSDLIWFLTPQFLPRDTYPSRWCCYALVRFLLSAGGLVSELFPDLLTDPFFFNTMGVPCDFGPNPADCPHTHMPLHPGWPANIPILQALDEVKEVAYAWYGTDVNGFFKFRPFEPNKWTNTATQHLTEQGTAPDLVTGGGYSELSSPYSNASLTRLKSVSGVKNFIYFLGVDENTNEIIQARRQDDLSINNRTAANYVGGRRPFVVANAVLVDQATADAAVEAAYQTARRPYDFVVAPCPMQPNIYPTPEFGQLITIQEKRILGPLPYAFFVLAVNTTFQAPALAYSTLECIWSGIGPAPGDSPSPPPPSRTIGGDGSIPGAARQNQGTVIMTGPMGAN